MPALQVGAGIVKSGLHLFCVACGTERSEQQCRVLAQVMSQIPQHPDCSGPQQKTRGPGWLCLKCSDGALAFSPNVFQVTAKSFSFSLLQYSCPRCLCSGGGGALHSPAVLLAAFLGSVEAQLGLELPWLKGGTEGFPGGWETSVPQRSRADPQPPGTDPS